MVRVARPGVTPPNRGVERAEYTLTCNWETQKELFLCVWAVEVTFNIQLTVTFAALVCCRCKALQNMLNAVRHLILFPFIFVLGQISLRFMSVPPQTSNTHTFTQHLADNLQHKKRNGKLPIITIILAQTNNDTLLVGVLLLEPHTEASFSN